MGVFFFSLTMFCQEKIKVKGQVLDFSYEPVPLASVTISQDDSNIVEYYTYTNDIGEFQIIINRIGEYDLKVNALGYDTWSYVLSIRDSQTQPNIKAVLLEKITELNEVMVSAEEVMRIKKDTISILVDVFTDGNENSLEDLLRKIPGLNVDLNGTIKVGNQEIEKLMIDGDDFFESGYKILSKNMPAYPIKSLEILKNFSNNSLLKGVEHSNKVALNLKLKEESKRVWFGNIEHAYGLVTENRYQAKANLMNFGKNNKYYFLTSLNNIGEDATGDITQLVQPYRSNEPASLGDNETLDNVISLTKDILGFKAIRTNFNNNELASLNAIFNPSAKLKVKTLAFFNWDEKGFFRNSITEVDANGSNFINSEDYMLHNSEKIFFGKTDLTYNISATQKLEATTKFNKGNFDDTSKLNFNGTATLESLQYNNTLYDQKIVYTNKYEDKKVLLMTGRYIDEISPQNYSLDQFLYQDLFPRLGTANTVIQTVQNRLQFFGFNTHILNRMDNGNLFEIQLGNINRKNNLLSSFSILQDSILLESPEDFQNITSYQVNELYLKSFYRWDLNRLGISAKLDAHQLFNRLALRDEYQTQNPFFITSNLGLDWEINKKNKIIANLTNTTTNTQILDVYESNILTGFRSFTSGTGRFNQLEASSLNVSYQLGNWSDRFFANTSFTYNQNHNFFSNNTLLEQNYAISEKILTKNREFISLSGNFDYYLKFLLSNIKVNLDYSASNFMNSINNGPLRNITTRNFEYGFELRSGFSSIFNYHLGNKWTENTIETNGINTFSNNVSFADFSLVFKDNWNISIKTERYSFENFENKKKYYFLDLDSNFILYKSKLNLGLTGKNLLNTRSFTNFMVSDIGSSTTEYRLMPRFVLLKLGYRF
ncbi:carboxypeptidase regulatory-like domain-containing protein [Maribacter sp. IgM3_T14_3]|uniref:TonB-dependent receptor n=1 Tax=Maribacter sp. IgM3_T14_3 TaxID=3415140 RepID=UPI003C6EF3A3